MAKTVLITGASKGIGAATAILFAQKGYNVVINYNESYETASLLCRSLSSNGYSVMALKANVANRLEVELMVKETLYRFGSLDILVNNAGIAHQALLTDTDEIDFDRIIDVNLKGPFYFAHAVLAQMRKQNTGLIINIGSVTGVEGSGYGMEYPTSKAGLMYGLTKSIAQYGAQYNIRCVCVSPGPVLTRASMANMKTLLGRAAEPKEIIDFCLYIASEKGQFINGDNIMIDGGRSAMGRG
jgi:3-oxoacyl-[acyl-carrier protein] reductase